MRGGTCPIEYDGPSPHGGAQIVVGLSRNASAAPSWGPERARSRVSSANPLVCKGLDPTPRIPRTTIGGLTGGGRTRAALHVHHLDTACRAEHSPGGNLGGPRDDEADI